MSLARRKFPEVDELVYCTVSRITNYAVYMVLEEYDGKEGMVHISEVASSWVRNVRNHVRENQKVVAKVLRVVPSKGQIDLSIRRVTAQQRRTKIRMWKRAQKAAKLIELVGQRLKKGATTARKIERLLTDKYGDALSGLELSLKHGSKVLEEARVPKDWAKALAKLAKSQITLPIVHIDGNFTIFVPRGDGIEIIKKALKKGLKAAKSMSDVEAELWTRGAPNYPIRVEAENYPDAEAALKRVIEVITAEIKSVNGVIEFERL
ncbi:MAG: translation initiation factor IF-2 subunit alpha [Candidatus Ranarchaeia archaeon]